MTEPMKIARVFETSDPKYVDLALREGWEYLGIASGQTYSGEPYHLYSLGWPAEKGETEIPLAPDDPRRYAGPDDDTSIGYITGI